LRQAWFACPDQNGNVEVGVFKKTPANVAEPALLSDSLGQFLDHNTAAEFRSIEHMFGSLRRQGLTVGGYPTVRPPDCAQVFRALEAVFKRCKAQFRKGDPQLVERFEQLIEGLHEFCRDIYPSEARAALLLHAEVLLFMGRSSRVIELVTPLAMRPYAVDNVRHCAKLIDVLAHAHILQGTLDQLRISFIAFGIWLIAQIGGPSSFWVARTMAPFVNFEPIDTAEPLRIGLIRLAAAGRMSAIRPHKGIVRRVTSPVVAWLCVAVMGLCYRSLKKRHRIANAPFSRHMDPAGPVLVTRAMGGIGDMLTMQPGLEVLAKRYGRPVDFAIPRKFFPIFEHDPSVRLVDVDGPPIDVARYRAFANLSFCPAARYESRIRPNVRRGRVELFARAMNVTPAQLRAQGWHINRFGADGDDERCDRFLGRHAFGKRPLIGVQPYSRDSYKDHVGIGQIIAALAKTYDIVIFHHVANGLPEGPGLANTAGMALGDSLALVSRLQAMVSVDSAFLHAASAYDVPVIGLFGPTGAHAVTRHHRKVTILSKPQVLRCVPCWRNEDLPCRVTGMVSTSPCIAAITTQEVIDAVAEAIG
jgi:ADP-heptose:LPS heptosyltransferase